MDEIDENEIDPAELDLIESRRLQAKNDKQDLPKSQVGISPAMENQQNSIASNVVSISNIPKSKKGNRQIIGPIDDTQLDMMYLYRREAKFEKYWASETKKSTIQSAHLYMIASSDTARKEIKDDKINRLISTLGIFGEERRIVESKILAVLNWSEIKIEEDMSEDILLAWLRAKYLPRFAAIENMIYRDYVWLHQQRASWFLIQAFSRIRTVFPDIRHDYLQIFPAHHDIIEWISPFGNIATPLKWRLSTDSQNLLKEIEGKLWAIYFKSFPVMTFPEYTDEVLKDIISTISIESKITSYFSKLDWLMTCFHELVAGNENFLEPFHNYINILKDIREWEKLAEIQPLLLREVNVRSKEDSVFYIDNIIDQALRIDEFFWKCTTSESMKKNIGNDFGFRAYGRWKEWIMFSSYQFWMRYWDWKDVLVDRWRKPDLPEVLRSVA